MIARKAAASPISPEACDSISGKTTKTETLANARARRRLRVALDGLTFEAEMIALENVREHIAKIATEGELDQEIGDAGTRNRLRALRDEARHEAARGELEQLKRELSSHTIPAQTRESEIPVATS